MPSRFPLNVLSPTTGAVFMVVTAPAVIVVVVVVVVMVVVMIVYEKTTGTEIPIIALPPNNVTSLRDYE